MTIKLYIGAHKTATTHIQSILEYNQEDLKQHTIKLSTPTELRKSWLGNFLNLCHKKEMNHIEDLRKELPSSGIWILSDENFTGTPYEFKVSKQGMYPNVGERLKCLKDLFPHAKIELFFSLRSYETFYRSTYLEVVRNRGYLPFSEYYNEEQFKDNSWVNVIKMFTNVIPQKDITLWCYEDIYKLMPYIINQMTELNNAKELISNYPIKKTRESLSKKTLDVLASLSSEMTQKESQKIVETVNQKYPLGDKYSKFIAFSSTVSQQFQVKYQKDINAIQELYPKIMFL